MVVLLLLAVIAVIAYLLLTTSPSGDNATTSPWATSKVKPPVDVDTWLHAQFRELLGREEPAQSDGYLRLTQDERTRLFQTILKRFRPETVGLPAGSARGILYYDQLVDLVDQLQRTGRYDMPPAVAANVRYQDEYQEKQRESERLSRSNPVLYDEDDDNWRCRHGEPVDTCGYCLKGY
jgi:hypothetical protein